MLINPNTSVRTTDMMVTACAPLLPAGIEICGVTARHGPAMILNPIALKAAETEVIRIGTTEAADGIIVAAFGDPASRHLRGLLRVPVIGIAEAALREAASGGRRFGIATTTPALAGTIEDTVRQLGFGPAFTGLRLTGRDPLTLAADPVAQEAALAAAATACLEQDGAEIVIIGGGPLSAAAAALRHRFGPVIVEPVPAAVHYLLARLTAPG